MGPLEIITIIVTSVLVIAIIGKHIYRKIKKLPTGECACCAKNKNNLVKMYHKKYK